MRRLGVEGDEKDVVEAKRQHRDPLSEQNFTNLRVGMTGAL